MARVVLLFLVFTFILVGLAHGKPKKKRSKSNGRNGVRGFVAMKTKLENALNMNSAPAILSVLRFQLPTLKQNICSSTRQPPVTPTTQATNTMANEQDFGWLFDLVSTAVAQTTVREMKIVLKSNPKLRRVLCGAGRSTRPTTPSTPTPPKPITTQPPPPPPAVTTNPEVKTSAGVSSFVDVALRDEGKSGNGATPARPTAPTATSGQPATPTQPPEQPPADASNDNEYSDEFLSIQAMRKRRSLDSNDVQEAEETDPLEHEMVQGTRPHEDDEREFHVATVIPTVFPVEDVQAVPRAMISASNVLEDGQFDETITIYSDPHDQAIEQEQKKGPPEADEKSLPPSADETSRQQADSSTQQQREETKLEVTPSKKEEIKTDDPQLGENLNANDVMVNKKEMFLADEMPEELPLVVDEKDNKDIKNDDQLVMTENKRNLHLPRRVMSNELDELKQEDWKTKKTAPGEEIKYEVDDNPAERSAKREANTRLKLKLGKLRKKNIFA